MVRVIDDLAEVHRLQKDARGWDDDMALVRCCIILLKLELLTQGNYSSSCIFEVVCAYEIVSGAAWSSGDAGRLWVCDSEGEWMAVGHGHLLSHTCPWRTT